MPYEMRAIVLMDEELPSALKAHRRGRPGFLPDGEILDVTFDERPTAEAEPEIGVTVSIRPQAATLPQAIEIRQAEICEMLIRYCLEHNIPVPQAGRKSVWIVDGNLALKVELPADLSFAEAADLPSLRVSSPTLA